MAESGKTAYSDSDLKIIAGLAIGLTIEKIADLAEISVSTVKRRKSATEIARGEAIMRGLIAQGETKTLEKVARDANERMTDVFDRAFALSEKLLNKAEALGDGATVEQLADIHKNFTMWAAKYKLSEAPKRLRHEGSVSHLHGVIQLTAEDKATLMGALRVTQAANKGLIAGADDVIDVDAN